MFKFYWICLNWNKCSTFKISHKNCTIRDYNNNVYMTENGGPLAKWKLLRQWLINKIQFS